jgi:hypothetical protein
VHLLTVFAGRRLRRISELDELFRQRLCDQTCALGGFVGDRNIDDGAVGMYGKVGGAYYKIGTNNATLAKIKWTDKDIHQAAGNAALGDGSVQNLTSSRFRDQLKNSGDDVNALLIPD